MVESEDEDNFPNDYEGLNFDNIPGLQASVIRTAEASVLSADPRNIVASTVTSPVPSTGSNGIEDMDPSFLAAVDALEARALGGVPQGPGSRPLLRTEHDGHPTEGKSALSSETTMTIKFRWYTESRLRRSPEWIEDSRDMDRVHEYATYASASALSPMKKRGKRKAEPREDIDVRSILAGYETELTCPICCDLFVGAQLANPCGHTCCGECGYGWLAQAQNKFEPTCAVCRSRLSVWQPLLPNFSVDNFVRQHLQALARSGRPEWQEKGYKTIEWNKRLESWRKQLAGRTANEKASRLRRRQSRYYQVEEYPYPVPLLIDESIDDDGEAIVARVAPRRRTRPRH